MGWGSDSPGVCASAGQGWATGAGSFPGPNGTAGHMPAAEWARRQLTQPHSCSRARGPCTRTRLSVFRSPRPKEPLADVTSPPDAAASHPLRTNEALPCLDSIRPCASDPKHPARRPQMISVAAWSRDERTRSP
ncbi:hypothetical protein CDD82_6223 [Ophiocordyceps australis]|uniref:Uncharacterized protein n=1 Tax=Ophiocordyceps australis TaxID=1399860 RepID=A0A2C5YR49_9HYPO|nr:hypothetical protein CDD82_6223 [Ophiocordyceps australis]